MLGANYSPRHGRQALGAGRSAPATKVAVGENLRFGAVRLDREHWSSAGPIRTIFKEVFAAAGLPYFNPRSFRKDAGAAGPTGLTLATSRYARMLDARYAAILARATDGVSGLLFKMHLNSSGKASLARLRYGDHKDFDEWIIPEIHMFVIDDAALARKAARLYLEGAPTDGVAERALRIFEASKVVGLSAARV